MANQFIKRAGSEDEFDIDKLVALERCAYDPIFFITTYVRIQHPTRGNVLFDLFDYQKDLITQLQSEERFDICLISRQMGKCCSSETVINSIKVPQVWYKKLLLRLLDKKTYDQICKMSDV